jgi:hypothetical protein
MTYRARAASGPRTRARRPEAPVALAAQVAPPRPDHGDVDAMVDRLLGWRLALDAMPRPVAPEPEPVRPRAPGGVTFL